MQDSFRTLQGKSLSYPLFFPDATRGVVRAVDNQDLLAAGVEGILVNTYHLWREFPEAKMRDFGGVRKMMNWNEAIISDSGGFQAMSIIKKGTGKITEEGLWFKPPNSRRILLTPEDSVKYQLAMGTDLVVVLDEYTHEGSTRREARESVERTISWAQRSRKAFDQECDRREIPKGKRPYLIAVNQGGKDFKLRRECNERLAEIGFDGYGHGGDGFTPERKLDLELSKMVVESAPKDALIYGLGVGKPEDIVNLSAQGFKIFDCVLPTRDGRHDRLYFWTGSTKLEGEFYTAKKSSKAPAKTYCDCHTCTNYGWDYVAYLFKLKETLAYRLASIHNLRFYMQLTERLREGVK